MFFRNLTFFRFPVSLKKSFEHIDQALTEAALKPVGVLEMQSRGFVSPFGRDEMAMSHGVGSALWLTLGGEDKILPSSVVNDALGKKVTRLALVLDDHVSFVLGEDLVLRKLKFLDGAVDQLENTERDSLHAELDARFALMSAELARLFLVLETA